MTPSTIAFGALSPPMASTAIFMTYATPFIFQVSIPYSLIKKIDCLVFLLLNNRLALDTPVKSAIGASARFELLLLVQLQEYMGIGY